MGRTSQEAEGVLVVKAGSEEGSLLAATVERGSVARVVVGWVESATG